MASNPTLRRALQFSSKYLVRIAISLVLASVFLAHSVGLLSWGILTAIENQLYDARVRVSMPLTTDPRVVIVDIDDKSLAAEGQWPWSRDKLARLMDLLFDKYGARLVGFDVVFAERDRIGGRLGDFVEQLRAQLPPEQRPLLEQALNQGAADAATDPQFARSLGNRAVLLGYSFKAQLQPGEPAEVGSLPAGLFDFSELKPAPAVPQALGYVGNLAILQEAALGGGYFDNPMVDEDGVFRRVPLFQEFQGKLYPSIAMAMTRIYLGKPEIKFDFEGAGAQARLTHVRLGERRLRTDPHSAVLVPFRGPQRTFPFVSATDVLNESAKIDTLFDTMVLIGATAPGLLDHRVTPIAHIYAGVEVHANVISALLDNKLWSYPASNLLYETTALFAIGLILAFALPYFSVLAGAGLLVGLIMLSVFINLLLWYGTRTVLPLASPVIYAILCTMMQMTYGFFVEMRGRRRLGQMFGQYIPSEVVAELDRLGKEISLEGESREMTVLFSDIRNFTPIAERLQPRELTALINEFLTPLTRTIHANRGTIDKYMGDAVMAFWGAPLTDEQHALHAVEAALDMVEVMRTLRADFANRGLPELNIGIGINTGPMIVGNMGSEFRVGYTVMGDAVNLGSRLEGLSKQYDTGIVVGEATVIKVAGFRFRELDRVRVKGKLEPISIFEPIGPENKLAERRRAELEAYERALALYRDNDWDGAGQAFEMLSMTYAGAGLYRIYTGRCAFYRSHPPPPSWDGVFSYTTK
ncbi:MAG: CHASE2 domain-containing protein [Nevskiales bacterium]